MHDCKLPSKPTLALLTARFLNNNYIVEQSQQQQEENAEKTESYKEQPTTAPKEQESSGDDPYQHFAAVLMNVTQVEQGRRFVMKIIQNKDDLKSKPSSILQQILPLLKSSNPIRRRGIAGTIKNSCFEKKFCLVAYP